MLIDSCDIYVDVSFGLDILGIHIKCLLKRTKQKKTMNDAIYMDRIASKLFNTYAPKTIEEVFEQDIFSDIAKEHERRNKLLLAPDTGENHGVCKRCGSDKNSLVPILQRRADEALDFMIVCNKCQAKWHDNS
jgi:DNA-directed RNA polymerase subunit M/transcription elongation factor TFIIS